MMKFLLKPVLAALALSAAVCTNAQSTNMAISLDANPADINTSGQYRLDVDHTVLPGVTSQNDLRTKSVSVGAWVKSNGNAGGIIRYGGLNHNNTNPVVQLYTNASGAITFQGFGAETLGITAMSFGANLPQNEWHYLAFALDFENNEVRCYFDGELTNTRTMVTSSFTQFDDTPYGFGFGSLAFRGQIDEVHIVDGAITNAEASALFNDQCASVDNLVGWYDLDAIADGSTGRFANKGTSTGVQAVYNRLIGSNWGSGLISCNISEAAPTLVEGREMILEDLENERTITVISADDQLGSVAIINPATEGSSVATKVAKVTIEARANADATFINWTNADDDVVANTATYAYTGTDDATFTAHFGYKIDASSGSSSNGNFTLRADGQIIPSGTVVLRGTEVTLEVEPSTGYGATVSINGDDVELTNNTYTFTPDANTTIAISFYERGYNFNLTVEGEGEVVVASTGSPTNFPTETYRPGEELPKINSLRFFVKPAQDYILSEFIFECAGKTNTYKEGAADNGYTLRNVTAAGYEGWIYIQGSAKVEGDVNAIVIFYSESAAITDIFTDQTDAPVEYYNLQGIRVAAENLTSGFYIIRKANESHTIYINK